ncbi:unnamed protein product [Orchesella dallaii]|uniref:Odorant receptor n=1 Tax=Orchesella dallaii TaxID=48710 RepID=A0ABP1R8E1_9HEXA
MIISYRSKMFIHSRLLLHKYFCLCAFADWNPLTDQFIPCCPFHLWNCHLFTYIGQFYPIILACYTYSKLTPDPDDLEQENGLVETVYTSTNVSGMMLTCLIGIIAVVAYRILAYHKRMTYLLNQIYKYCHILEEMMAQKQVNFNNEQRKTIKIYGYLHFVSAFLSTAMPMGYAAFFTSDLEPVNQLFRDWLEVEVNFEIRSFPIIFLFLWAALTGGGAAYMYLNLVISYMVLTVISISSLSPTNIVQLVRKPGSKTLEYTIETTSFGRMSEQDAILAYRAQQLFTVYINEIVASVFMSLHQVALMVILVGSSFVLITVSKDLVAAEPSVVCFLFSCSFASVLCISCECFILGKILDLSNQFLVNSTNLTSRKPVYRKFIVSCTPLSLKMAYPFFSIDKDTFVNFMFQYLDFLVQLLLSQ